jgi:hypothetical protein
VCPSTLLLPNRSSLVWSKAHFRNRNNLTSLPSHAHRGAARAHHNISPAAFTGCARSRYLSTGTSQSSAAQGGGDGRQEGKKGGPMVEAAKRADAPAKWTPQWMWKGLRDTAAHYYHGSQLLAVSS